MTDLQTLYRNARTIIRLARRSGLDAAALRAHALFLSALGGVRKDELVAASTSASINALEAGYLEASLTAVLPGLPLGSRLSMSNKQGRVELVKESAGWKLTRVGAKKYPPEGVIFNPITDRHDAPDAVEIWDDDHVVAWAKEIGIMGWSPAAAEHQPRCRDCEWTGMYRCRECAAILTPDNMVAVPEESPAVDDKDGGSDNCSAFTTERTFKDCAGCGWYRCRECGHFTNEEEDLIR